MKEKSTNPAILPGQVTLEEFERAHEKFWEMAMKPESEINEMFNSGMFNGLAIGYAKLGLKALGYGAKEVEQLERAMERAFSDYSAEVARKAYNET